MAEVDGMLMDAQPKTKASLRTLTVPDFVMSMLAEHLGRRQLDGTEAGAYVFVAPHGGPLRATNYRNRVWGPAVKKAGLNGLTIHGLRHFATDLMVELGIHPRVMQHRIGHSTSRITMERYAHVTDEADKEAAALLEKALSDPGSRLGHERGSA